ncbi:uncharacterized protein TRUGW13939_04531 [Talaromyces rugulosus]|uniref:Uncharacterized protein n=1 Tax=Talaromyces rugulosus TaxID=121627 RepID=A0A7H8QTZ0_TALRU|nr:uncharacterized protein TRUGW13939_04531 [Talaromyces rugulosus]QKX57419.1 hypothetical protein TRUGW13939_04531 [Talaromyces rugulosus]
MVLAPGRRSHPNMRVPPPNTADSDSNDIVNEKPTADTAPAVPRETIIKLLAFTLAMIVAPIGMYFLSVNTVLKGKPSFAGALAALTANVVLVAYIVVAWQEDKEDQAKRREKKGQ